MEKASFNLVEKWSLKCFDVKESKHGMVLNCVMNGKKKEDGTYPKGMPIRVICTSGKCEIVPDDYTNCYISVDGSFGVSDYTKQDGTTVQSFTIFATKVEMRKLNNN